ncbi:hypothetical protein [Peptoniphilus genitalis]|uniref:Uncharacterized protein n=1 Tax=Peptoniphilus genitalis TaxID=3036303 RepID=A0ABY4TKA2_9FIRM|nr:hypothetical protein [Peptoniphilus sp. SAHP1]URN40923.1 hypothetical protein M9426_06610 [Peptoniphilus sp. SAHP1]
MDTKNVKDIKIVGADTQRVMSNNEVWWKKENPWLPVKGPVFIDNWRLIYFQHQLNDYCPMKAVEFKIDKAGYLAEVGEYYSTGDISIEFFDFYNKKGSYVSSKSSYDKKTEIFCMVFDEPVYKFEELYLKNTDFPSKYKEDKIEKVLNLQFRVVK